MEELLSPAPAGSHKSAIIFASPLWDSQLPHVLNGSVRIPPGGEIRATADDGRKMKYTTGSIAQQLRSLRRLLRDTKQRSHFTNPAREIEFSAVILGYSDGSTRVAKITSRQRNRITGRHTIVGTMKALINTPQEDKPIKKIIHIHTHPEPTSVFPSWNTQMAIAPSPSDFMFLKTLEEKLTFEGVVPSVEGIILPNCQTCDDLFLYYRHEGLDP